MARSCELTAETDTVQQRKYSIMRIVSADNAFSKILTDKVGKRAV